MQVFATELMAWIKEAQFKQVVLVGGSAAAGLLPTRAEHIHYAATSALEGDLAKLETQPFAKCIRLVAGGEKEDLTSADGPSIPEGLFEAIFLKIDMFDVFHV